MEKPSFKPPWIMILVSSGSSERATCFMPIVKASSDSTGHVSHHCDANGCKCLWNGNIKIVFLISFLSKRGTRQSDDIDFGHWLKILIDLYLDLRPHIPNEIRLGGHCLENTLQPQNLFSPGWEYQEIYPIRTKWWWNRVEEINNPPFPYHLPSSWLMEIDLEKDLY